MKGRVALCTICCTLAGCGSSIGHRGVVLEVETKTVNVYYATDRAPEASDESGVKYGWERAYLEQDKPYAVGVCQVEITRYRNHDQSLPLPRFRNAMVTLVSTSPLERSQFYDRIREDMWYAAADGLFVFVHGYNTSFEKAAKRSAEIWYDVGFDGPPIMFSWPSRGGSFWRGVFSYFGDAETAEWSSIHLQAFLEDLVAETTSEKLFADEPARIHLIAHSMGCRALTRALMLIGDDLKAHDPPIFCDVILAAPDIDRDVFSDVILPDLLESGVADHYTLYASSSDAVIRTSGMLQVYPRAGNAEDGIVVVDADNFDTIDASSISSGWLDLRHDYFISEPQVIRDLIEILVKGNRDPRGSGRGMQRRVDTPGQPWILAAEKAISD